MGSSEAVAHETAFASFAGAASDPRTVRSLSLGLEPPSDARPVFAPLRSMRARQEGLLVEQHAQVEADGEGDGVVPQRAETKGERPSTEDGEHGDVHRVAREAVQANGHEILGWG